MLGDDLLKIDPDLGIWDRSRKYKLYPNSYVGQSLIINPDKHLLNSSLSTRIPLLSPFVHLHNDALHSLLSGQASLARTVAG